MTPRALTALLTATLALTAAPSALAVPTSVALDGNTLTVAGDGSDETYSVAITLDAMFNGTAKVSGPAGFNGFAVPGCTTTATSVSCPIATAEGIALDTKGGADTTNEDSAYPVVFQFLGSGFIETDAGPGSDTFNARTMPLGPDESGGAVDDTFNGLKGIGDQFRSEPGNDTYYGDAIAQTVTPVIGPIPSDVSSLDRFDASGNPTGVTISLAASPSGPTTSSAAPASTPCGWGAPPRSRSTRATSYSTNPPPLVLSPLTISLDDQANDGGAGTDEHDNLHADVENVDGSIDLP